MISGRARDECDEQGFMECHMREKAGCSCAVGVWWVYRMGPSPWRGLIVIRHGPTKPGRVVVDSGPLEPSTHPRTNWA